MLAPMYRKPDRSPLPFGTDAQPSRFRPSVVSATLLVGIAAGIAVGVIGRRRTT